MHTDRIFRGAAALAGALLLGTAHPLPAQDTLEAGTRLEAPAAPEVRRRGDRIVVGRDAVIERHEVVEGKVVVTGGDLVVRGHVQGNVTVTGGTLRLEPGAGIGGSAQVTGGDLINAGSVGGDARVLAGRLINQHGTVGGEMRIEGGETAVAARHGARDGRLQMSQRGFMRNFGEGLSGLFSTLALGLFLAGLGAAAVFYAHPRLDRVSDSVRADSLRAGALGLATHFLVLPAYVIGAVLLVLSIIGIPVLLVFLPLFPVLVMAAWAAGLVAVAHALGERTAERRGTWDTQYRNSYAYVFTGVGVLLAPLVAANLLKMTGFLGFAGDLLEVLARMGLLVAATVGLGAILLSRAGQEGPWRWRRGPAHDPLFDGPGAGGTGV
jgi:cytoskeletal protein CcmA (bactofilin family)